MDSLKTQSRPESPSQTNIEIDPCQNFSALAELPTELILWISDFLPSIDLICFSLCNHRVRAILQRRHRKLVLAQYNKLAFLTRLERDLPPYFACEFCEILHKFDGSESLGLSGTRKKLEQTYQLPCVKSGEWFCHQVVIYTHLGSKDSFLPLSFLQVKLAMRRFYYGPSAGISTDSLYYTQVRNYGERFGGKSDSEIIWLFSRDATICPEPLGFYVRTQNIVMAKDWEKIISLSYPTFFPVLGIYVFRLCRHMTLLNYIQPWVESFSKRGAANEIRSSEYRCATCDIDYHIKAFEFDSHPTIIVTRWLNLGLGLTTDDPSWQRQCPRRYWKPNSELQLNILKGIASPRMCFETTGGKSLEELNSHNLEHLRDEKYKAKMQLSSTSDYWHLGALLRGNHRLNMSTRGY
ncbi:hypothetical protein N7493_002748 [Penicillium malachiteum]|uniref:F-box domain-containing protein n=1 Tax=Penicillium malachiteum TaxID=1324776 RepID=A0AAD6MZ25_9EURO|nr:hypothetical protein N7493_002748 [Penicillium malachiteum]